MSPSSFQKGLLDDEAVNHGAGHVHPYFCESLCTMLRAGRQSDAIALLMAGDFDVQYRSSRDQTALHLAPEAGLHEVTALLIAKGADPNARDALGRTPLMSAARSGDVLSLKHLLGAGADPHLATYNTRWTALMWAARHGQRAVIAVLLGIGVDPRAEGATGENALAIARRYKRTAAAQLLFEVS